jgi:hypothetical protein
MASTYRQAPQTFKRSVDRLWLSTWPEDDPALPKSAHCCVQREAVLGRRQRVRCPLGGWQYVLAAVVAKTRASGESGEVHFCTLEQS